MFEDCDIAGQAECDGSGLSAGKIFVRVLAQRAGLHTVPLPRIVVPKAPLDDDAAIAYAKAKGYGYVINGEVQDYKNASRMTLHAAHADVSVNVLRTSDGRLMGSFNFQNSSATGFTTPDAMLEDMAKQVAESIASESKGGGKRGQKQGKGDFLISGS
jgi:hypothetical protein